VFLLENAISSKSVLFMRMNKLQLDTRLLAILFLKAFHVLLIAIHTDWGKNTDWSNWLMLPSLICCCQR